VAPTHCAKTWRYAEAAPWSAQPIPLISMYIKAKAWRGQQAITVDRLCGCLATIDSFGREENRLARLARCGELSHDHPDLHGWSPGRHFGV
jgi:hypothetical protein